MKNLFIYLIFLGLFFNCKTERKETSNKVKKSITTQKNTIASGKKQDNQHFIKATIDSVANSEVYYNYKKAPYSIYSYYIEGDFEDYSHWSDKMFGRCCTEADLSYSELLNFIIKANVNHKKYPFGHLSDYKYTTTYVFNQSQKMEISLQIDKRNDFHMAMTNGKNTDDILKEADTVMYPIKLSLINGYVKSKDLFYKNGRVKNMEVLVNDQSVGIVELIDTPLIQEFSINALFTKDDIITLKPLTYYKGTTYDDICISEIQSNLGYITHPSINKKYVFNDLRE